MQTRFDALLFVAMKNKAVRSDKEDLKKDKKIEKISREKSAVYPKELEPKEGMKMQRLCIHPLKECVRKSPKS